MGCFCLLLKFGFFWKNRTKQNTFPAPCSLYSNRPRGQWLKFSTSFPSSQVTLQEIVTIAQPGLPCPSVQGAEMFWSPLRTPALSTGPASHHVPWGGHKEEEAPQAAALGIGTAAALPACCPRLPWDLLYGFSESSACWKPQPGPPPSVQEQAL